MQHIKRVWKSPELVNVSAQFQEAIGGHPLVAETLVSRGISTLQEALAFLDPGLYTPTPGTALPDLEKAVDRLQHAIQTGERIGVWGDFDADGQTATAILVSGLRRLGADVIFHIPVRGKESHGVNIPHLQEMIDSGVRLVLTCDTGVTAHEAVDYAKSRGVPVIITDHHTLPLELPDALAVVNSQRLPVGHPLNPLCGVGCAYKVIEQLFIQHGIPEEADQLLDLVALGTIADLAPLTGDNRYLVQRGLRLLRAGPRLSIRAMLETAGTDYHNLSEEHISFVIAPRMNALGRLEDANPMVSFLLTDDAEEAKVWASRLDGLNNQRKEQSNQVFSAAVSQVERDSALLETPALVLAHPTWPGGIVGIVASHLVERYRKPVVLFSAPEDGIARGSARSIEGINITAAIAENAQLLHGFGGHPMAAGLSLPTEDIPRFRKALGRTIARMMAENPPQMELKINADLMLEEISLDLVKDLERLAPFGPGNPPLVFTTWNLELVGKSFIGKNKEHLKLIVRDPSDVEKTVLWWGGADQLLPEGHFDLAYSLRASSYEGSEDVSIEWVDAREIETPEEEEPPPSAALSFHDLRGSPQPQTELERICRQYRPLIWAEGNHGLQMDTANRLQLHPAPALVLWNTPPGWQELDEIIQKVSPDQVFVFSMQTTPADQNVFIRKVAALLSAAIDQGNGRIWLKEIAAATGQREAATQKAVELLAAFGKIEIVSLEEGLLEVRRAHRSPDAARQSKVNLALEKLLDETVEFQKFFRKSSLESFFSPFAKKKGRE